MTEFTPEKQLVIAALEVLMYVSERNLKQGTTGTILVERGSIVKLAAAVEALHPGALARTREIEKEERDDE